MSIQIITTEDGSHSLFNAELNETYHSVHGAVQESKHVFIRNGLDFLIDHYNPERIRILEIGFGTGLNALLTLQGAHRNSDIEYTTLETYPLEEAVWGALNYHNSLVAKDCFEKLHHAAWDVPVAIAENFKLIKINVALEVVNLPSDYYNLVYFDAFAPSKQPALWTYAMLQKVAESMGDQSAFVTYCARGQLKRDLKNLGFEVQTLPGPPGKKEMVRGVR